MDMYKKLNISKKINKVLQKYLCVKRKIVKNREEGNYMEESKITVIQENSVELRFEIEFDERLNLQDYTIKFEVYESTVTGSNVKKFIKTNKKVTEIIARDNDISVYVRPEDTRTFDIQSSSYVYLLEINKPNSNYDTDDIITLDRGVFEVLPRIIS